MKKKVIYVVMLALVTLFVAGVVLFAESADDCTSSAKVRQKAL